MTNKGKKVPAYFQPAFLLHSDSFWINSINFLAAAVSGILRSLIMPICLGGISSFSSISNKVPFFIYSSAKSLTTQEMPNPLQANWTIRSLVASSNSGERVTECLAKKSSTYCLVEVFFSRITIDIWQAPLQKPSVRQVHQTGDWQQSSPEFFSLQVFNAFVAG